MLAAILHGKIRGSRSEDLATSVAFGALEHLPVEDGIQPLLMSMVGPPCPAWVGQSSAFELKYWPKWKDRSAGDPAEPDVALWVTAGADRYLLAVECKWRAPLSGKAQLAKQVRQGRAVASAVGAHFAGLIYLTDDAVLPRADLLVSAEVLRGWGLQPPPLWWLSWRRVASVLRKASQSRTPSGGRATSVALADQAARCLRRWRLDHSFEVGALTLHPAPT